MLRASIILTLIELHLDINTNFQEERDEHLLSLTDLNALRDELLVSSTQISRRLIAKHWALTPEDNFSVQELFEGLTNCTIFVDWSETKSFYLLLHMLHILACIYWVDSHPASLPF